MKFMDKSLLTLGSIITVSDKILKIGKVINKVSRLTGTNSGSNSREELIKRRNKSISHDLRKVYIKVT